LSGDRVARVAFHSGGTSGYRPSATYSVCHVIVVASSHRASSVLWFSVPLAVPS
jgi:hypothetical protein